MDKSELAYQICDMIAYDLQWPIDGRSLSSTTHLGTNGLALNGFMAIQLAIRLESVFDVSIPDDEMLAFPFLTIGDLAEYVVSLRFDLT